MKADRIYTNQSLRIKARIRDSEGNLVDPQSIQFEMMKPNDTEYSTYTVMTTPAVKKESVGIFYIDIECETQGKYKYSWFTYGNPASSWKSFFEVEDARYP